MEKHFSLLEIQMREVNFSSNLYLNVKRKVKNDTETYVHYTTNGQHEDFISGFQRRGKKKVGHLK